MDVLWDRTPMFISISMMTKPAVEVPFFQPSAVEALRLPAETQGQRLANPAGTAEN